ncbi:histidine kinase [Streptomyces sp. SID2888]|uniref:histidine kinase dimerization/phosphoacceptor domain-containing protein n=1 Tax=Streptomyces sp. SID2888 TaxID=2690256 RepID=UPI001F28760F|nr:histidine kinase [Streptomyces sp. SID2888]
MKATGAPSPGPVHTVFDIGLGSGPTHRSRGAARSSIRGSRGGTLGNLINVIIPDRWVRAASTLGIGTVFLTATTIQSLALAQSWGAESWAPGAVTALVVCALALARRRSRTWTAVVGLSVAALAVLVPLLPGTRLPAGLGPAVSLGLAVLIGSAVRTLPAVRAGAIAGAGLLVIAAQSVIRATSAVLGIAIAAWLAALAVGLLLRLLDQRAVATAEQVRRAERLALARELHDVVAHHITGMLIQTQATQVIAHRDPAGVPESLSGIEAAGSEAMAAMRRVVGLLRDTDDAAPAAPGPEERQRLRRVRQRRRWHIDPYHHTAARPAVLRRDHFDPGGQPFELRAGHEQPACPASSSRVSPATCTRPPHSTMRWSQTCSMSPSRREESTALAPSSRTNSIRFSRNPFRSNGSSAAAGSSKISNSGRLAAATVSASCARWPPESCPAFCARFSPA